MGFYTFARAANMAPVMINKEAINICLGETVSHSEKTIRLNVTAMMVFELINGTSFEIGVW